MTYNYKKSLYLLLIVWPPIVHILSHGLITTQELFNKIIIKCICYHCFLNFMGVMTSSDILDTCSAAFTKAPLTGQNIFVTKDPVIRLAKDNHEWIRVLSD